MNIQTRAPSVALFVAIALGLALVVYALVSGSSWAVLIGLAGLLVAGKSTLILVKRYGASDQPQ